MRFDGRVALVTGASRGIGAAVARGFAAEGARVAVNCLPTDHMVVLAEQVVDDIRSAGGCAMVAPADVSQARSVAAMVADVSAELGLIDALIVNAADLSRGVWDAIEETKWDEVMAVNLKGAWLCAREVVPCMRQRGRGTIVTVSSVTVQLGWEHGLHYVSSKSALIGFTRSLARTLGRDSIRVNCVMPGAIRTEHEQEVDDDPESVDARITSLQCLPRRGVAADLVGPCLFLSSDESGFVAGQVLVVDGGWVHY